MSLLALNGLRVPEAIGADIESLGVEGGHRTLTMRKGEMTVTYTEEFCAKYNQTAFDADYRSEPPEHFEPLVRASSQPTAPPDGRRQVTTPTGGQPRPSDRGLRQSVSLWLWSSSGWFCSPARRTSG
jgi:hypothetical protein